jgi:cytoskeleton protein RodZ
MFEIGSSLREARLRQGIDFPEAEQSTKVRSKYLRALEDEQFDVLPAETYVRGFLRTYAEFLGLDGQLYVDEFNSRFVATGDEPVRTRRATPSPRARQQRKFESRAVMFALIGIAAVTGLIIVAWRYGGGQKAAILPTGPSLTQAQPPLGSAAPPPLLSIRGVRGSSLVQVRAKSSTGKTLYSGTLAIGKVQRFRAPSRLWLRIAAPGNVRVVVAGHTVALRTTAGVTALVAGKQLRVLGR